MIESTKTNACLELKKLSMVKMRWIYCKADIFAASLWIFWQFLSATTAPAVDLALRGFFRTTVGWARDASPLLGCSVFGDETIMRASNWRSPEIQKTFRNHEKLNMKWRWTLSLLRCLVIILLFNIYLSTDQTLNLSIRPDAQSMELPFICWYADTVLYLLFLFLSIYHSS